MKDFFKYPSHENVLPLRHIRIIIYHHFFLVMWLPILLFYRYWLKEGIIIQLLSKADELVKNKCAFYQKVAKRIRDGLQEVNENQNEEQ